MALSERDRIGEEGAGAREVLERLRQASVNQSVDDMSRLYAVDAVTNSRSPHQASHPGSRAGTKS